jgi:hypothetical protein
VMGTLVLRGSCSPCSKMRSSSNRACDATHAGTENDKKNVDHSCELVCPISHMLRTDDHVLAAPNKAVLVMARNAAEASSRASFRDHLHN